MTYVDFDGSLNAILKKLRAALDAILRIIRALSKPFPGGDIVSSHPVMVENLGVERSTSPRSMPPGSRPNSTKIRGAGHRVAKLVSTRHLIYAASAVALVALACPRMVRAP